jgi:LmeA-like phospholipid-binding
MTEWWPFDRSRVEEWKRGWTEILALSSAAAAAALPQPGTPPADPFAALVDAARGWLVGKKRTFRFDGQDVTMTVSDISVEGVNLARLVGRSDCVRIAARDVQWDGYRLERMEIQARNVQLRPGVRLTMAAEPVFCEAFVSAATVSRWLAGVSPRLELAMRAGVPQIGLTGLPWGRLEVETGAEGRNISLRPRALHLFGQRVALRSPAFFLAPPELPAGLILTSVAPAPGGFLVRGLLTEWQRSLSREVVERIAAGMRAGRDRLDI